MAVIPTFLNALTTRSVFKLKSLAASTTPQAASLKFVVGVPARALILSILGVEINEFKIILNQYEHKFIFNYWC